MFYRMHIYERSESYLEKQVDRSQPLCKLQIDFSDYASLEFPCFLSRSFFTPQKKIAVKYFTAPDTHLPKTHMAFGTSWTLP